MKPATWLLAAVTALPGATSAATLIHAGHLIDGVANSATDAVTIVIDGKDIKAVEKGYRAPAAGDTVIDLKDATVLPGLWDMHVHLTSEYNKNAQLEGFTLNEADVALNGAAFAERTLNAGFTTVRDLGSAFNASIALRNAINKGTVRGPRIFAAGKAIATTGGHADPTNGWAQRLMGEPGPREGVVNGPYQAAEAVRQRYKDGADTIKITATGGVLSVAKNGLNPQFTEEEVRAVVSTARDYGFKVAAHAHGAEGVKRAIRGGVDSIEHGTFMDDEAIKLMKEHGTYYVPTLSAGRWVADRAKDPISSRRWCGRRRPRSARCCSRRSPRPTRPASRSCSVPTPAYPPTATTPRNSATWSRAACRRWPRSRRRRRCRRTSWRSTTTWARSRRASSPTSSR